LVANNWPILHAAIPIVVLATTGVSAPVAAEAPAQGSTSTTQEVVHLQEAQSVEEYVRTYFDDTPILARIAKCETHFRHYEPDGTVVRGDINEKDLGVMQINEYYHGESAEKMGYDIYTLHGNLEYARNLYEREGVQPWRSSAHCWAEQGSHVARR
jgi:hypothetical protein